MGIKVTQLTPRSILSGSDYFFMSSDLGGNYTSSKVSVQSLYVNINNSGKITASYVVSASYALSSSYAPANPSYSSSISTIKQNTLVTGNSYLITSSWATYAVSSSNSLTASFSSNSTLSISSSWASRSLSSSYSPVEPAYSSSVSSVKQNMLVSGSIYNITSSWSNNSVTSSYVATSSWASNVISASYALTASFSMNAASVSNVSSSWASQSLSASYSPVEPAYSASVSTVKQNILVTGNTYTITSSWSNNSISASYAPGSPSISSSYASTSSWASNVVSASYALTASFSMNAASVSNVSSSWASQSLSASYAPVEPAYSASVSTVKQNALVTGNTYTITSSWANNTVSSSYSITSSISNIVVGKLTTLNFSATTSIDFNASMFHSSSLSGSVYLTCSNLGAVKMASIKLFANGSNQNIYYPTTWGWIGTAPTTLSSSKIGIISLTCYGSTDTDIVGVFGTQL